MPCAVALVPGLASNSKRGLAFLQIEGDKRVNANAEFNKLTEKKRFDLLNRFQHWRDGGVHDDYHHGWSSKENSSCYVFKWKSGRVHQRMYGFLAHPRQNTDPKFLACVLVSYTPKTTHETDPDHLSALNELRKRADVIHAVNKIFREI